MAIMNLSSRPLRLTQLQNPKLNISFRPHFSLHNSRIYGVYRDKAQTFSFTLSCKLNATRKKQGGKEKSVPSKIRVPESDGGAPTLLDVGDAGNDASPTGPPRVKKSKAGGLGLLRRLPKRVLASLSNLTLAISEMFALAGLMAIGNFSLMFFVYS